MIVQFVKFESNKEHDDLLDIAHERAPRFRAIPGLIQKHYLRLDKPNRYGGFYIWESRAAMAEFRESELAKSIPAAYGVSGAPDVDVYEKLFSLRT